MCYLCYENTPKSHSTCLTNDFNKYRTHIKKCTVPFGDVASTYDKDTVSPISAGLDKGVVAVKAQIGLYNGNVNNSIKLEKNNTLNILIAVVSRRIDIIYGFSV